MDMSTLIGVSMALDACFSMSICALLVALFR